MFIQGKVKYSKLQQKLQQYTQRKAAAATPAVNSTNRTVEVHHFLQYLSFLPLCFNCTNSAANCAAVTLQFIVLLFMFRY